MKRSFKPNATQLALALVLIGLRPAIGAEPMTNAARPEGAAAEGRPADHEAALNSLDAQIDEIEATLDHAADAAEQTAAKLRLNALKERRSALRKDYTQAKFDALQADTKAEYEKVATWTKRTVVAPTEKVDASAAEASARPLVVANPDAEVLTSYTNIYKLRPSPDDKASVKTALDALDAELKRFKAHAKSLPKGDGRRALEKRVRALDERKAGLETDFTAAGWDSLVRDVKTERDQMVK